MKLTKLLILGVTLTLSACNGGSGIEPTPTPKDMTKVLDAVLNIGENYRMTVEESYKADYGDFQYIGVNTTTTVRESLSYYKSINNVMNSSMTNEELRAFLNSYLGDGANETPFEDLIPLMDEYFGFKITKEGDGYKVYSHREELPIYMKFNLVTPYLYDCWFTSSNGEQAGRYCKTTQFVYSSIADTVNCGFSLSFLTNSKTHLSWDENNNWYDYNVRYADSDNFEGFGKLTSMHVVLNEEYELDCIKVTLVDKDVTYVVNTELTIKFDIGEQKVVPPSDNGLLICEHEEQYADQCIYDGEYYHFHCCDNCGGVDADSIEKCAFDENGVCLDCHIGPRDAMSVIFADDGVSLAAVTYNPISNLLYYFFPNFDATVMGTTDPDGITIVNSGYVPYSADYNFCSIYVYSYGGKTFAVEETCLKDDFNATRYLVIEDCTFNNNTITGGTVTIYETDKPLPKKK